MSATAVATSSSGWRTPVDVSAWTSTTARAFGWASSASATCSGGTMRPIGCSSSTTSHPLGRAESASRRPNTPFSPTIPVSPGSTTFTTEASIPALPVPDTANVSRLSVRKA